ncbi:hypothetical protein DB347_09650 [Opitutaceae bacterium EW11]|nr:hypothetical protein DB347_09650 [Opitutaceae bacterium EW11]
MPRPAGCEWAASLDQDAEVLRVERTFSQGGNAEGPVAPKTWSSRLEIRWQARWQGAPRFLV